MQGPALGRRASPPTDDWRRVPGAPPRVLGHRGARQRAPENTLAAFELAVDEGAAGVELDVRLDGAREVVVLHDRTLERVSASRDPRDVETIPTAELGSLELGDGQRIPLLREVLAWAERRDAWVNVELKQDVSERRLLVARVAACLRAAPRAARRVLLSSFHPGIVLELARRGLPCPVALLVHGATLSPRAAAWSELGATGLHPADALVTPALLEAVHARGGLVNVWTVNDPERARVLAGLGVDGIVTDDPRGVLGALGHSQVA